MAKCEHISAFLEALARLEVTSRVSVSADGSEDPCSVSADGYEDPCLAYYCETCQTEWDESEDDSEESELHPIPIDVAPKCKAQIVFGAEFLDLQEWSPGTTLRDILAKNNQSMGMDAVGYKSYFFKRSHPPTGFAGTYLKNQSDGKAVKFISCSLEDEILEGCQYVLISSRIQDFGEK